MKKADVIVVVKADIQRLKSRERYINNRNIFLSLEVQSGLWDAIATLEKYLAKIENGSK